MDEPLGVADIVGAVCVDHELDVGSEAQPCGFTLAADTCGAPSMAPTRIFTDVETTRSDVSLELFANFIRGHPATRCVGGLPVGPPAVEKAPTGCPRDLPRISQSAMSTALIAATDVPLRDSSGMA